MAWHVNIIEQRSRASWWQRGPGKSTFGWSASSPEGGYEFNGGPFATADEALDSARASIEALGGGIGTSNVVADGRTIE